MMVNPDYSWERNYDYNISLFDLGVVVSVTMGDKVIGKFATGWEVVPLCCGDWEVFYQLRHVTTVSTGDEARDFVELTVSLGFDPATIGN